MGMVFRPEPRSAPAHIKIKGGGRHRGGLLERALCFVGSSKLAERGGEPAVRKWKVGVRSDHSLDRLECSLVLAAEIMPDRYLQQSQRKRRVAGVESEVPLKSRQAFLRSS